MAQKPIPTTSFYGSKSTEIRITNRGVVETKRFTAVEIPDGFDSEDEEDDDIDLHDPDDGDYNPLRDEYEEEIVDSNDEITNHEGADDSDDNDEVHLQGSRTMGRGSHDAAVDKGKDKSCKPVYRWRKIKNAKMNTQFHGERFPAPPIDEISPLEYFKMFFDDDLIAHLSHQTNIYSVQKSGTSVNTTPDEMEQYLGILLMTGIIKMPQYRMYWSSETRIPVIADSMSVNRFDKIKRFLHCNDNSNVLPREHPDYDKLFKVRPVVDSVLAACRSIPQEEKHSIDEQIIPTKCRSGLRQYIPKKPHKWGIKVWARCGVSGIVYDFDVYKGANNKDAENHSLGVGGNVVANLCSTLPEKVGNKVYFDNYFSSIDLLQFLRQKQIWAVGTIRADRLKGAEKLLKSKKDLQKKGRGSMDWCVDANRNITVVRWFDNGIVQLVSNHIGEEAGSLARHWSAKEKKFIDIPRPLMVEEYNIHMGGVDLCDMLLSLYRIRLRSTKYYMRIVFYCIGVAVVNGWLLYRRHCNQKSMPSKEQKTLLKFQSEVANALLCSGKLPSSTKRRRGRPSAAAEVTPPTKKKGKAMTPLPNDDVRFDGVGHMPFFTEKQQRCRFCPKGYSFVSCEKCNIQLCLTKGRNCFKDFHQ